jgi:hypothetical protein
MSRIDDIAPAGLREKRARLAVAEGQSPLAYRPLLVEVDYAEIGDDGLSLPLVVEVQGPSASSYTRREFTRMRPASLAFTPREGGSFLVTLRELCHDRVWGSLEVEVGGRPAAATRESAAPVVVIDEPAAGAYMPTAVDADFAATVTARGGSTISSVHFLLEGEADLGAASNTTGDVWELSIDFDYADRGDHLVFCRAVDSAGLVTVAGPVPVVVLTDPPAVAITSPTAGATVYEGKQLTIEGTCSDDGEVVDVEVFCGTTSLGYATLDGLGGWTRTWTPTAGQVGAASLTAEATDDTGQQTTSAAVAITVGSAIARVVALGPDAFFFGANWIIDAGNAESGDQVSQWTDLSGNDYHATQSTQTAQPTATTTPSGDDGVLFTKSDGYIGDQLSSNGLRGQLSLSAACTIAVAHRPETYSTNSWVYNADNTDFGLLVNPGIGARVYLGGGAYASTSDVRYEDVDYLETFRFDGGAGPGNDDKCDWWLNGTAKTLSFTGTVGTALPSLTSASAFAIGHNGGTTAAYNGTVTALVAFATALSDENVTELHSALTFLLKATFS